MDPIFSQGTNLLVTLYACGDRVIIFEGGEPLLWRDGAYTFRDIARYARTHFPVIGVTTNGTLPFDIRMVL